MFQTRETGVVAVENLFLTRVLLSHPPHVHTSHPGKFGNIWRRPLWLQPVDVTSM